MTIDLKNRASKIFRYFFGNSIIFALVLVLILILFHIDSSQPKSVIIIPILLLAAALLLEWFRATKYFYNYLINTLGRYVSLEPESKLITFHSKQYGTHQTYNIDKVILHSHIKNKQPFENPNRIDDKIENFLVAKGNNRYSHIWYIEVKTNHEESLFITPLMINKSKLKIKVNTISYEENPIIKTVANKRNYCTTL